MAPLLAHPPPVDQKCHRRPFVCTWSRITPPIAPQPRAACADFPAARLADHPGRGTFAGYPPRLTHRPPGPPPPFLLPIAKIAANNAICLRYAAGNIRCGPGVSPGESSAGGATQRSCHVAGSHLPFLMLFFPPPLPEEGAPVTARSSHSIGAGSNSPSHTIDATHTRTRPPIPLPARLNK